VKKGTFLDTPRNHGAKFAPVVQPTLKAGMDAMALAVLAFLVK
jgi:hypothetical protein